MIPPRPDPAGIGGSRADALTFARVPARLLGLVLIAWTSASCGLGSTSSYFDAGPPTDRGLPAAAGETVLLAFADVAARPGDTVELVGVAIRDPSVAVSPSLRVILRKDTANAGVGAGYPGELPPEIPLSALRDPVGLTLRPEDGVAQLLIELAAPSQTLSYSGVDLTFRVDGGSEQTESFPAAGKVCVAPARPQGCAVEHTSF